MNTKKADTITTTTFTSDTASTTNSEVIISMEVSPQVTHTTTTPNGALHLAESTSPTESYPDITIKPQGISICCKKKFL